jgi:hypothetical protein
MVTIVAVSINGSVVRVQCDGLSRDSILSKNIVLAGCRELDTEGRDGVAVDTKIWSLPESMILSYAVGHLPVLQAPEPIVEPVVEAVDPLASLSPEEREAHQARRQRLDREARRRRDAERRARARAAKAAPVVAPEVEAVPVKAKKPAKKPSKQLK